jgi:hypothetical protein
MGTVSIATLFRAHLQGITIQFIADASEHCLAHLHGSQWDEPAVIDHAISHFERNGMRKVGAYSHFYDSADVYLP